MTGGGKPGKPKSGFPPFPPPLEIALRFPHSHSFNDSLYIKGEVKAALLRNQQRRVGQVDLPNAPKRVALRAPQGFAPAGGRERIHQRVGPNETIERGQIKLTKAPLRPESRTVPETASAATNRRRHKLPLGNVA